MGLALWGNTKYVGGGGGSELLRSCITSVTGYARGSLLLGLRVLMRVEVSVPPCVGLILWENRKYVCGGGGRWVLGLGMFRVAVLGMYVYVGPLILISKLRVVVRGWVVFGGA